METTRPISAAISQLQALEGQDYGALAALKGSYAYERFRLDIRQIPKDPYAPPGTGIYGASVPMAEAGFPAGLYDTPARRIATADFVTRAFHAACGTFCPGRRGTGHGGLIAIAPPGQEILARTAVAIDAERIEARFFLGFPAHGRAIDAATARTMLLEELPRIVAASLYYAALDGKALARHLATAEDAAFLRDRLPALGLVAFIAAGAILPRASGIDPAPLESKSVVAFEPPADLRVTVELPHRGTVSGMGIPSGITVIVGGGYHGKSTLLQALQLGIYDHIPGDGRELCVCVPGAVSIRAASGRSVVNTDISTFIGNLPLRIDPESFSTENASGSTSQAASIAESIEAGAGLLLMDEDTCAANFMSRDGRMQRLVAREDEPITAFIDRARPLYEELGISSILVMGGSGDYFDIADCVIQMTAFRPRHVTEQARAVARDFPAHRLPEGSAAFPRPRERIPVAGPLDPLNEYGHLRIGATETHTLIYGRHAVDLSDVEHLTETAQTRALGWGIEYAKRYMDGRATLHEVVSRVSADLHTHGLDRLDPKLTGNLAGFRALELAAALNRLRGFAARQVRS